MLSTRNKQIYNDYINGTNIVDLSVKYHVSDFTVKAVIRHWNFYTKTKKVDTALIDAVSDLPMAQNGKTRLLNSLFRHDVNTLDKLNEKTSEELLTYCGIGKLCIESLLEAKLIKE